MTIFLEVIVAILHNSGWFEQRKVNTSEYAQMLKSEGYPVHASVIDFLSCFGGLRVIHPHHRVPQEKDVFCLDPAVGIEGICAERVFEEYELRVGTPLCIIGNALRDYMTLLMDAEGKVYAGYDECLVMIGDSGIDAIEALCRGRNSLEIPELEDV